VTWWRSDGLSVSIICQGLLRLRSGGSKLI